jgi:hypothetical protein
MRRVLVGTVHAETFLGRVDLDGRINAEQVAHASHMAVAMRLHYEVKS